RPTGLVDPKTGRRPFAVVQLRPENREKTAFSLVGFQTSLKYPEQKRILRLIPALRKAEFLVYGSMHRNTFINSPKLLKKNLELKKEEGIFFAGQITGSEGYTENIATGIVAALNIFNKIHKRREIIFPEETMIGALIKYITEKEGEFQPTSAHFGLLPPIEEKLSKKEKRRRMFKRGIKRLKEFIESGDFPYYKS
ncbi:MAG TPA: FADH(2)-oxidizing methylenetetrahydrofolate--tRNA-(uracil(54)-C(5))-methyltransferase TrmFO, partial [Thermoplasmata archaeon]|nr:FADH(2)-oxidizing methylenetetrahydrofolate--tRNA-(uracil(54)-C(5))-methyltransferase TrmFO [Thermoplasmata archaeon]